MVYHNLLSKVSESATHIVGKKRHRKQTHTHIQTDSQTGEQSEFQINFTIIHALIISKNIMFRLCTDLELFSNYFLMSAKRRCCCCNPHPPLHLLLPLLRCERRFHGKWQNPKLILMMLPQPRQLAVAEHRTWRTRAYIMFVNHKSLLGGQSMCCQPRAVRPHLPFPSHIKGSIAIERSLCTLRLIFS